MNHNFIHCSDYTEECPQSCLQARLVKELTSEMAVSFKHLKGTLDCPSVAFYLATKAKMESSATILERKSQIHSSEEKKERIENGNTPYFHCPLYPVLTEDIYDEWRDSYDKYFIDLCSGEGPLTSDIPITYAEILKFINRDSFADTIVLYEKSQGRSISFKQARLVTDWLIEQTLFDIQEQIEDAFILLNECVDENTTGWDEEKVDRFFDEQGEYLKKHAHEW